MKTRLVAGTINNYPDQEGLRVYNLDASNRGIWDAGIEAFVQPDFVMDIAHMPEFRDDMFDEVICHHVLEHLAPGQTILALREFFRILKPLGTFDVEVPDMDVVAAQWLSGERSQADLQQWIHGEDLDGPFDGHRYSWTARSMQEALLETGFNILQEPKEPNLAARFIAAKPTPPPEEEQ